MLDYQYTHPSWHPILKKALQAMDQDYLNQLAHQTILPQMSQLFNAFRQPLNQTHSILFGETPYPRAESANGYAFWDNAVKHLWSEKGLDKKLNRATSLRNIMKMLLIAAGKLTSSDTSQPAINRADKTDLVQTLEQLFQNLIDHGFLLLNASLVLSEQHKNHDAKHWHIFVDVILEAIAKQNPNCQLILFGKIAERINQLPSSEHFNKLISEHPYNISFITNPTVIDFFKPLHLLHDK